MSARNLSTFRIRSSDANPTRKVSKRVEICHSNPYRLHKFQRQLRSEAWRTKLGSPVSFKGRNRLLQYSLREYSAQDWITKNASVEVGGRRLN
jgi:hypothetical protein